MPSQGIAVLSANFAESSATVAKARFEEVVRDREDLALADREAAAFSASVKPVGASCFAAAPHTVDVG
jgi:hypothetical protein